MTNNSTDEDRSSRRRQRAEQMRKEREAAERRRRTLISTAVVAVLVLLIGVGAYAVKTAHDHREQTAAETKMIVPRGTVDSAVKITPDAGKKLASGSPSVEVYEDFLCPYCEQFETANSAYLQKLAKAGEIQLSYRPIAILDNTQTEHYSSRASSAAMCALEAGGEASFLKAHNALYSDQPSEQAGSFPTNSDLRKTLEKAGVTGLSASCLAKATYAPWARSISESTVKGSKAYLKKWPKIEASTPTVLINGKQVTVQTNAELKAALQQAGL